MEALISETQFVAKVVVIDADENVLLLQRSETDEHRPGGTDIPGGGVKDDELDDPRRAACRELREETHIKATPDDLQLLHAESKILTDPETLSPVLRVWYYYLLQLRAMPPKIKVSHEHSGFEIVSRKEAPDRAADYPRAQRVLRDLNKLFDGDGDE